MSTCSNCKTTILLGGVRSGDQIFCGKPCHQNALSSGLPMFIPDEEVDDHVATVHQGPCPVCHGPGPVDVHESHRVMSCVILTWFKSEQRISCRRCGRKHQFGEMLFTSVVGWWGFPLGILLTPIAILSNFIGLIAPPSGRQPSKKLRKEVHKRLLSQPRMHHAPPNLAEPSQPAQTPNPNPETGVETADKFAGFPLLGKPS